MGQGVDIAKLDNPEMAEALDDMKDQLIIALVKRLGGQVTMPATEIDDTGGVVLRMGVDGTDFNFKVEKKQ